jgi:type IV pilus assembly protein PilA
MVKLINKLKNRKGFTLIELIVVLAVLAVIMAIAVPRFMGVQEKAKLDADYASGEMLAKAAELYYVQSATTITSPIKANTVPTTYIEGIVFKSDTFDDYELKDLYITYGSNGEVKKIETDETTPKQLYPRH